MERRRCPLNRHYCRQSVTLVPMAAPIIRWTTLVLLDPVFPLLADIGDALTHLQVGLGCMNWHFSSSWNLGCCFINWRFSIASFLECKIITKYFCALGCVVHIYIYTFWFVSEDKVRFEWLPLSRNRTCEPARYSFGDIGDLRTFQNSRASVSVVWLVPTVQTRGLSEMK